jgi:DNA repair protein RadC
MNMENVKIYDRAAGCMRQQITRTRNEVHETQTKWIPLGIATKKITKSADVVELLKPCYEQQDWHMREFMYMINLTKANKVISIVKISEGGQSGTVCDLKCVFAEALHARASAIILSHNHPSGRAIPSEMDDRLMKRAVEIGKMMECIVLDHVIMTPEGPYYSYADERAI